MIDWLALLDSLVVGTAASLYTRWQIIRRLRRGGVPTCLARALVKGDFKFTGVRMEVPPTLPDWLEGDIK